MSRQTLQHWTARSLGPAPRLAVALAVIVFGYTHVAGQNKATAPNPSVKANSGTVPKTPDGQPDMQGTWVNFNTTPLEAGGHAQGPDRNYRGPALEKRRSLVVDPPDGLVPVMPWAEQKRDYDFTHMEDSWVHHTPWERCITRGVPGGMLPAPYNAAYQIVQAPGYVAILYEMVQDARIIPLDGRPHLPQNMRFWNGDSRGRWEGGTLVVDVTNFNDKGMIATSTEQGRIRGIPHSDAMHVVERFTPVGTDAINYEVTITDPKVYTRPWTVAIPLRRDETYQMFEYSCHEGNIAMENIIHAGLVRQKAEEEAAKKGSK